MTAPTLLYVASESWFSSTRLLPFLRDAGFVTVAVCVPDSLVAASRHVDARIVVPAAGMATAVREAHARHGATLVVPADEAAMTLLHRLAADRSPEGAPLAATLARSLGAIAARPDALGKRAINGRAAALGIPVPSQLVTAWPHEARAFARRVGYPVVLKKDNTYGGIGVRRCDGDADLLGGWLWLQARSRIGRGAARAIGLAGRGLAGPLIGRLGQAATPLIAQPFLSGPLAFRSFVADQGRVLAGLTGVAETVDPPPFGASSVVRFVDHPGIEQATASLVADLGLSGFGGIDFILDDATGEAQLLELNPRVTPICHLGRALGVDLCAALHALATGAPVPAQASVTERVVALFPNELQRDPGAALLATASHDMPLDDPDVIDAWLATLPDEAGPTRAFLAARRAPAPAAAPA